MLNRLIREPLFHFLVFALVIFAAYGVLGPTDSRQPDSIVVTAPKIEQLAAIFAKTWQRPPTDAELKGLIDDYVKEEIYVREALALGLDKDDTVIRRRLRLKMEFMNDSSVDTLVPTDADLDAYLKLHADEFAVEPMTAFLQVFLNPQQRGAKIDQDATSILDTLHANPAADPATLGDATLLPSKLPLSSKASIAQTFGADLAEAADKATPGTWSGPVKSTFGLHLIYVTEHTAGRVPKLAEVHEGVARDWSNQKRKAAEEQRLTELLKRYKVTIEALPISAAQTETKP